MLSNVLILVMWQKCVQNIYKKRIQLGKTYIDLLIIQKIFYAVLKTMIWAALVNSVTGTEIFKIQKQPPEVFSKIQIKVLKNSREATGLFLLTLLNF